MASTYTPIATQTLGSAAASVTFSSISSAYTDLVLVVNGNTSGDLDLQMQVGNGSVDTGTNYSVTFLYGTGSAAGSGRSANQSAMGLGGIYNSGSGIGTNLVSIQNYSNTSTYKTVLSRSNSGGQVNARVNLWRSTSAINIIKVLVESAGNLNTGTTVTLYGIKAA